MDKSKLEKLLSPLEEFITNDEFIKAFENVLKIVKENKDEVERAIKELEKTYKNLISKNSDAHSANLDELKSTFNKRLEEVLKFKNELNTKIDERLAKITDGKDADEEKIVKDVLAQIVMPEYKETVLDDAFEIRNKLETLNGEERLAISAINGLEEKLKEIDSKPLGKGGGGFSKMAMDIHIIDDETPPETPNGVITDFTLSHIPSPATSLKVYKDGQRMKLTTDYTLSGTTVSFVSAPLTDSLITFDFRI